MKRTILLIGLGIAFLAVSAWVALSGGRSARAVRAKFRLGGAILTITSALTAASCEPFVISCYDPVMPPSNQVFSTTASGSELRNGDAIAIDIHSAFEAEVTFTLEDKDGNELQREVITLPGDGRYISTTFILSVGDYRGEATLRYTYQEFIDVEDSIVNREIDIVIVE